MDDDQLSRQLIDILLSAHGYRVQTAACGVEALRRLSDAAGEGCPDVVLIDQHMPGLAGNALLQGFRRRCGPETRLVAISATAPNPGEMTEYDGFLLKPFVVEDLERVLGQDGGGPGSGGAGANDGVAVDEATLERLRGTMPAGQVAALYAFCIDDTRVRFARMGEHAAAGRDAAYRHEAHTIKGGCGMIGAAEVHRIASEMERRGLAGDCGGRSEELRAEFDAAIGRLERVVLTYRMG